MAEGETTEVKIAQPGGIRVSGRLTTRGQPVARVRITAIQPERGDTNGTSPKTDAAGWYSLDVPGPGTYRLMASWGPIRGVKVTLEVPDGAADIVRDVELPSGEVAGVVADAATGGAVDRAEVVALPEGASFRSLTSIFRSLQEATMTDDGGRFALANLPTGRYTIAVFAEGFANARVDRVAVDERRRAPDLKIALDRGVPV